MTGSISILNKFLKSSEMDNEQSLLVKITQVTREIQENHPELCKFLSEMPETIASEENPKVNTEALQNYYESLVELLEKTNQN